MSDYSQEKGLSLKGPDIMPTTDEQRHITPPAFAIIWFGMAVQLVTFILAAQLYPALSPMMILLACLVGNGITVIILTLTGDIGIMYGIPYAVYIRACFGYLGTHIPAFIRAIPAIFWFGFQTWFGAYAMNTIMVMLTGYSNLNLLIVAFAIVQVVNMMYGVDAVAKFEKLAAPLILVIGILLLNLVLRENNATMGEVLRTGGQGGISFGYAVVAQMGAYITMALNIPDFTRYLCCTDKTKKSWWQVNFPSFWSQGAGLLSAMLLFTFIGMTSGVLTGNWNPIDVMIQTIGPNSPLLLIVCLLFIVLAQWSTNTAANLIPPVYIIINFFPRKISLRIATVIAGAAGVLMRPWVFGDQIGTVLVVISALLGPIAGIMICDYYLLRKRKLNLQELYKAGGQYEYWNNVNPAAIIAYVPAMLLAFKWPDYGFWAAFGISMVLYYPLMKYWIAHKYPQPEILNPNQPLNVTYTESA